MENQSLNDNQSDRQGVGVSQQQPVFQEPSVSEKFSSEYLDSNDGGTINENSRPPYFKFFKYFLIATGILLIGATTILGIKKYLDMSKENEVITLTYWGLTDEISTISPIINKYQSENPNVKIKYVKQSNKDYRERLLNSLAKGSGPDIFRFHNTWVPMLSNNLSELPVTLFDTETYEKTFYSTVIADLKRNTNLVGIPLQIDGLAMYINEEIFTQDQKLIPNTWDELRRVAVELTQIDDEGRIVRAGVALGRTDNVDHWQDLLSLMMLQNGADPSNPNNQLGQDALLFFTIFSQKDRVWDDTMPSSTQAFSAGKLAIYFGPSWRAREFRLANPNLKFKVVPMPQLPKSVVTQPNVNIANYWAEGVWDKSKAQEEAWKFLKYMSTQEVLKTRYQFMNVAGLSGEAFPRQDMASLLIDDPYLGAYVRQANSYKSWFMVSETNDGQTGLNTRLSEVYARAVADIYENKNPQEALAPVSTNVSQIFSDYGIK